MSDDRNPYLPVTRQVMLERLRHDWCLLKEVQAGIRETDMSPEQIQGGIGALELAQRAVRRG